MLKNFLIVAVRHLLSNKVYVFINIIGLGMALACCIVAYQNSKFNWNFDNAHVNIDHIYKIHSIRDNKGDIREYGRIPMPMGPAIANDLPGVGDVFRFESHVFTVRDSKMGKDKVFDTSVCYADEGLLESFTFEEVSGNPLAYKALDQAVVTRQYAAKFYGDEDPMGRILTVFDDTGMSFNFVISGVVNKASVNSSLHFEVLLNFKNRFRMYDDDVKGNWESFAQNTFLYLDDPSNASMVESQLAAYTSIQQEARPDFLVSQFVLSPMRDHADLARNVNWDNLNKTMPIQAVLVPQIMALLILLVACFNFTNTAIANSNRRLKEIGIRKVLGGNRRQLINQFMLENLTICALGLVVGVSVAIYLVPAYGAMWGDMELKMDFQQDYLLFVFLAVLLVFTTVIAGLYPSLFISKYKPVNILRGSVNIKGSGSLTKILLATQYAFTAIAIFASVAFIQNARYQDTLDLGYEHEQVIALSLLNETQYEKIYASLLSNPDVESISSAKNHIGRGNYGFTLENDELEIDVSMLDVGAGYLETMGLEIVEGRTFDKNLEATDSKSSLIVNEKTVEAFGWDEPIGQQVTVNDTTTFTVVGVVKNFYLYGFYSPIEPVGFRLKSLRFDDDGTYSFLVAKANINNVSDVYEYLEEEWNDKIPNKTFSGFYQNSLLEGAKRTNNNILTIFTFLGLVAFILSSLGLFTMVSINLVKRTKEIGVRKVLGGSTSHLMIIVGRNYLFLLLISSLLGLLAGYYLIDALIAMVFDNYKELNALTFLIPFLVIIGISLLITSLRTLKSAVANPVNSLRYE